MVTDPQLIGEISERHNVDIRIYAQPGRYGSEHYSLSIELQNNEKVILECIEPTSLYIYLEDLVKAIIASRELLTKWPKFEDAQAPEME